MSKLELSILVMIINKMYGVLGVRFCEEEIKMIRELESLIDE